MERKCEVCPKRYIADMRNIKRGWGLCCSKSCSAKKRERLKPSYNSSRVAYNNRKRAGLLSREETGYYERTGRERPEENYELGWDAHKTY